MSESTAVVKVDTKRAEKNSLVKNTDEMSLVDAAKLLMNSGLVKTSEDLGKIATKLSFGRSLGLNDVTSINGIGLSPNGTLILSAALMLSLIKRSGKYRLKYIGRDDKKCEIEVFEKVDNEWHSCGSSCSFSWEDAVRAKLATKPTYVMFPRQMLTARCISDVFKTHCSDCAGVAVYTPEEIPDSGMRTDPESGEMVNDAEYEVKASPINKFSGPVSPAAELQTLIAETGADVESLRKQYEVKPGQDFKPSQVTHLIGVLKARKSAQPK